MKAEAGRQDGARSFLILVNGGPKVKSPPSRSSFDDHMHVPTKEGCLRANRATCRSSKNT